MSEGMEILERLGLSCYTQRLIAEGFDTWATLLDITESDLNDLNVKLGHRRKLQRAIADYRRESGGVPLLDSFTSDVSHDSTASIRQSFEPHQSRRSKSHGPEDTVRTKRKYRRHPKPDVNAPDRPPSAFVIFSNHTRIELKAQDLSFTEMAKVVGERWQELGAESRKRYEWQASSAKERYNAELAVYKKTQNYTRHAEYLIVFKARNRGTETALSAPLTTTLPANRRLAECRRVRLNNESSTATQDSHDSSDVGAPTRRKSVMSVHSITSTPSESNTVPEGYSAARSPTKRFSTGMQDLATRDRRYSNSHVEPPISTNLPLSTRNDAIGSSHVESRYLHTDLPHATFTRPPSAVSPASLQENGYPMLPNPHSQADIGYANRALHLPEILPGQQRHGSPLMSFTAMMDVDSPHSRRFLPTSQAPSSGPPLMKWDPSRSGSKRVEEVKRVLGRIAEGGRVGEGGRIK